MKRLLNVKCWLLCICVWAVKVSALEVTDYLGRTVRLAKPAERIVALAPHVVENIFSAGGGERLVGVVDYSDYPEAAKKIPRVGTISSHSMEAIVALKPDLVVAWTGSGGAKVLGQLEALGLTVYMSDPRKLPDVARSIRDYGFLMGTEKIAEATAEQFLNHLTALQVQYQHRAELSVLYQVWHTPLQTLSDEHIISDVIHLCGGRNVFGDAKIVAPKINLEAVFARNPDVIVASGMGVARPEWLDDWKRWPSLKAVEKGNLYFVPPDIIQRHTARILEGAQLMCESLDKARIKIKG
ncbi:MAG: cobalamin-binding protein [Marinagarivorans sp.]|nr:cobalamin-binding protein [Marinagarivorans sp.]